MRAYWSTVSFLSTVVCDTWLPLSSLFLVCHCVPLFVNDCICQTPAANDTEVQVFRKMTEKLILGKALWIFKCFCM